MEPSIGAQARLDVLLLEMGRCISAWAKVETELAQLAIEVSQTPQMHSTPGKIAEVSSFRALLEMVNIGIIDMKPADDQANLSASWKALYWQLGERYRWLREIAHYSAIYESDSDEFVLTPKMSLFWSTSDIQVGTPIEPLTREGLRSRTTSFEDSATSVRDLRTHYLGRGETGQISVNKQNDTTN